MRRNALLTAILACAAGLGLAAQSEPEKPIIIPAKTDVFITLTSRVTTKTAAVGDRFTSQVAVPVTINDEIVIPVGSYILGRVARTERAGRVRGRAALELQFDTVILPSGVTRNFEAVVQSAESQDAGAVDETTGTIHTSGNQTVEAVKTAGGVAATGAGVGAIASRGWKGVGVGAAIGAAAGALYGTAQRGPDVVLEKGSQVSVSLYTDVSLAKPDPSKPRYTVRP
ncbi:MAG: hypothetical protein ACR2L2_08855 [Acidobacteriota bacterium]